MATMLPFPLAAQEEAPEASPPSLVELSRSWFEWLDANRPVEPEAVIRAPRPAAWAPDWSRTGLEQRRTEYLQYQGRLKAVDSFGFDEADRVDAALLAASMARVHWQLEVLNRPQRDPGFYLEQTLGSVFELLIETPEPGEPDVEELIRRLHRFTPTINAAKLGLDRTVPELAEAAIGRIGEVDARVDAMEQALSPYVSERLRYDFNVGIRAARQSLATYKDWLTVSMPRFREPAAAGGSRYQWYLGHVAAVPRPPEALLVETELVLAKIGAELAVSRHRFPGAPGATALDSAARVVQMAAISRQEVANFLATADLGAPSGNPPGFEVAALPASLSAIADGGERIWFGRLGSQGTRRYLAPSRQEAGYVEFQAWADPRLLVTWDGLPGRTAQVLAASDHPRVVRRRAVGVTLSEGLALYFNEQVVQAGLYAFKPASQFIALGILRHAAALAQADLRLAYGEWSVDETAEFLAGEAGLGEARARRETEALIASPGRAGAVFAAYGQIIRMLADAAAALGQDFSLAEFNARLLANAHVPVALQRWEYLGLEDELDQLVEQRGRPATVPE